MFKNTASQKLIAFAFDSTTGLPKTGDAANLTAYVSKDYGAATILSDTTATQIDATNAAGYYLFDLTQAETNADTLLFTAKSSTANIVVVGAPAVVFTVPQNPAVVGSVMTIDFTQVGLTPRALDSVADGALTLGDALVSAIAAATGKESVSGTTYTVKTPSTGTTIRTFTLDSGSNPTSRT